MCLSVPGRLVEKDGDAGKADVDGNLVTVNLACVPDVQIGEYVLVHAGFAIEKYDEAEALETIQMLKSL